MKYELHKNFIKLYQKLPAKIQKVTKEKISLFVENIYNSELNNHALVGKYLGYRSINITGDYRAIYKIISKNKIIFVTIGTHSQLYR